ncbi:hypothetical protein ACHAWF_004400 [Thalassiosira exigua]
MSSRMMDYVSFLVSLIEAQEWTKFEKAALSNQERFRLISEVISCCEDLNGMTLIHTCVRFDPPAAILEQMIKFYPRALKRVDSMGRTPLHVAAGSSASLEVIGCLAANYPHACNIRDEDGRTPLHFACDASCILFDEDRHIPRAPPDLVTIKILLVASLEAVTLEDVDEINAVELAILSDAHRSGEIFAERETRRAALLLEKKKSKQIGLESLQIMQMNTMGRLFKV